MSIKYTSIKYKPNNRDTKKRIVCPLVFLFLPSYGLDYRCGSDSDLKMQSETTSLEMSEQPDSRNLSHASIMVQRCHASLELFFGLADEGDTAI